MAARSSIHSFRTHSSDGNTQNTMAFVHRRKRRLRNESQVSINHLGPRGWDITKKLVTEPQELEGFTKDVHFSLLLAPLWTWARLPHLRLVMLFKMQLHSSALLFEKTHGAHEQPPSSTSLGTSCQSKVLWTSWLSTEHPILAQSLTAYEYNTSGLNYPPRVFTQTHV